MHGLLVTAVTLWAGISMCLVISKPTHPRLGSFAASVVAMVVVHRLGDDPPGSLI